jgi:hypothetical protein
MNDTHTLYTSLGTSLLDHSSAIVSASASLSSVRFLMVFVKVVEYNLSHSGWLELHQFPLRWKHKSGLRTLLFGNIVSKPVKDFLKMYYIIFYWQV